LKVGKKQKRKGMSKGKYIWDEWKDDDDQDGRDGSIGFEVPRGNRSESRSNVRPPLPSSKSTGKGSALPPPPSYKSIDKYISSSPGSQYERMSKVTAANLEKVLENTFSSIAIVNLSL
jgi:hypothetical protein